MNSKPCQLLFQQKPKKEIEWLLTTSRYPILQYNSNLITLYLSNCLALYTFIAVRIFPTNSLRQHSKINVLRLQHWKAIKKLAPTGLAIKMISFRKTFAFLLSSFAALSDWRLARGIISNWQQLRRQLSLIHMLYSIWNFTEPKSNWVLEIFFCETKKKLQFYCIIKQSGTDWITLWQRDRVGKIVSSTVRQNNNKTQNRNLKSRIQNWRCSFYDLRITFIFISTLYEMEQGWCLDILWKSRGKER